jgi:hypothetical protein
MTDNKSKNMSLQLAEARREIESLKAAVRISNRIMHDQVVANQAAWIEWRHGKGAEAAMNWIQNGLFGPGHIPDENALWGKDSQAWFDAYQYEPFPECACGRPSNILWMGKGACSSECLAVLEEQAEKQGGDK